MSRPVKCPACGLSFNRDLMPYVQHKNRYYHKECFDKMNNQSAQDSQDLEQLEGYIVKLLKLEHMNARVKKQIRDMKESYKFTYSGIMKSLVYFYEVKGNSISKANGGIGIVPYVYEDAKKYFYTIFMAQAQNKDKDAESYVKKGRQIVIRPPERKVKPKRTVDLDAILEEVMADGE